MAQRYTEDDMIEVEKLREMGLSWTDVAKRMGRINPNGLPNARGVMERYVAWKKARGETIPTKKPIYDSVETFSEPVESPLPAQVESPSVQDMLQQIVPTSTPTMSQEDVTPPTPTSFTTQSASGNAPIVSNAATPTIPMAAAVQPKRQHTKLVPPSQKKMRSLESMSRKERFDYITRTIHDNPRSRHVFLNILSRDEQEIFLHEYSQILLEQDSLTNAEEQQLFNAILNLVLYYRARARDTKAYEDFTTKKTLSYDSRWQDEAETCQKQYLDSIKNLKLSREQRLKDMARSGNTFLDYAEMFTRKEQQESIVDEIMEISKLTENELKRLQQNGWVIFGKSPNNIETVRYEEEADNQG